MRIDNHWLSGATQMPSPNFDERPVDSVISLIVVHCISLPPNQFGGSYIDQFFCNRLNPDEHVYFKDICQLKVSAHLLIKRCGEIVQYVAFDKRAWHAGASEYQGKPRCNNFSIGIELEGTEYTDYTDEQYRQLSSAINTLLDHYPDLSKQHIVGHSDIAPNRKTDPGESFAWKRLLSELS